MKQRCLLLLLSALAGCSNLDEPVVVGELTSDRIELSAEFSEPVVSIDVSEGMPVSRGQLILRLDDRRARAKLDEVAAQADEAAARLDELKRGPRAERIEQAHTALDGAQTDLEFREAELERIRNLTGRGLASPEALDQAKAAWDAAKTAVGLRRSELEEALAGTTIEELRQAEAALAQAEARRAAAEIDLERHRIVAPVDGIADARLIDIGERPTVGTPVFILLGGEQAYARVFIPESLRASVLAGTPATLHVDGRPEPLAGRVRWVSADASYTPYYALTERDRGHLSYVAKVDIVDDVERLPDGIPVSVVFDEDALLD